MIVILMELLDGMAPLVPLHHRTEHYCHEKVRGAIQFLDRYVIF